MKSAIFACFTMLSCATGASWVMAAPLTAHRAIYDFEMLNNQRSSGFSSAEGRLAYEITGSSCEGWSINYRFASRYVETEGNVRLNDTQLVSWESGDGTELRMNQKQYYDNKLANENKIAVKRKTVDGEAEGEISLPTQKAFKLTVDTYFPVFFQSRLLDEAMTGQTRNTSLVYEGTDGENPYRVISLIGKKKLTGDHSTDASLQDAAMLKTVPSWPITTSYYSADDKLADQPLYQSHYNMYENGVSTDLKFDYGNYELKGTLKNLDLLPMTPCD